MLRFGSNDTINFRNDSPCGYVDPKHIDGRIAHFGDEQDGSEEDGSERGLLAEKDDEPEGSDLECLSEQEDKPDPNEQSSLKDQEMGRLGDVGTHSTARFRSPSSFSSTTAISEHRGEDDPEIIAQFKLASLYPLADVEIDEPRIGVDCNEESLGVLENGEKSINPLGSAFEDQDVTMTILTFDDQISNAKGAPKAFSKLKATFSDQGEDAESQSTLEEDPEDQTMDDSELMKKSLDVMDIEQDVVAEKKVELKKSLNSTEDFEKVDSAVAMESNEMPLDEERSVHLESPKHPTMPPKLRKSSREELSVQLEPPIHLTLPPELRRSSRNAAAKNKPTLEALNSPFRGKKKPVFKKAVTHLQAGDHITVFTKS
jgi:hypothetical protein